MLVKQTANNSIHVTWWLEPAKRSPKELIPEIDDGEFYSPNP